MPAVNEAAVAQDVKSHVKDTDGTKDEHRCLEHGGIHDHAHAAEDGVKAGGESQSQGNGPKDVNPSKKWNWNRVHVQQGADDDVTGVNRRGDFRQHQAGHSEETQDISRAAAEAELEEFRHGEHLHAGSEEYT